MKVLKRCGNLEDFNKQKIVEAILKAGNIGARLAEIIADSIEQIQNVQGDINNYQTEVSAVLNDTDADSINGFLDGLFK